MQVGVPIHGEKGRGPEVVDESLNAFLIDSTSRRHVVAGHYAGKPTFSLYYDVFIYFQYPRNTVTCYSVILHSNIFGTRIHISRKDIFQLGKAGLGLGAIADSISDSASVTVISLS